MPLFIQAGLWGLLAGSALVLGAAVAWFLSVPRRLIAAVMAFGSGVLISALSFELMEEAFRRGGFDSLPLAFLGAPLSTLPRTFGFPVAARSTGSGRAISNLPMMKVGWRSRSGLCWMEFRNRS